MPKREADAVVELVKSLLAEKAALVNKETVLISNLNSLLSRIGYQVTPLDQKTALAKRRRRRGRKPGRRPGRAATKLAKAQAKQKKG